MIRYSRLILLEQLTSTCMVIVMHYPQIVDLGRSQILYDGGQWTNAASTCGQASYLTLDEQDS